MAQVVQQVVQHARLAQALLRDFVVVRERAAGGGATVGQDRLLELGLVPVLVIPPLLAHRARPWRGAGLVLALAQGRKLLAGSLKMTEALPQPAMTGTSRI